jgi:hypothetical protein
MSQNLDLVSSIVAGWVRGDFTTSDWAHPEIEYVIADGPDPGRWKGRADMWDAWRDLLGAWDEFNGELEDVREIDRARVLVFLRASGRGRASGLELGQMLAQGTNLFEIRDGKVTRLSLWFDRDRALADLGLEG